MQQVSYVCACGDLDISADASEHSQDASRQENRGASKNFSILYLECQNAPDRNLRKSGETAVPRNRPVQYAQNGELILSAVHGAR